MSHSGSELQHACRSAGRPRFARATNVVTLRCNLKCRLCVISAPYYRQPWHPSLEYVNRVTDRLLAIADYHIFDLTGGEPLLRKGLPQIFDHLLQYKDHVSGRFGFQSNGSLPISDDLIRAIKPFGDKFKIIMDNYGAGLSRYSEENYHKLKENGIPTEWRHQNADRRYCDGWVDYTGGGSVCRSEEEAKKLFARCAQPQIMGFCATVVEGKVLPCPVMYPLKNLYGINWREWEYVDLFDETETVEDKRTKWVGIYRLNMLEACRNCSGICDDSERFVPAEQLTAEEIQRITRGDE